MEAAGGSAVQIEDQLAPKRCGHFEDKTIVELDEANERVRIAVESRASKDTVVIARTDALAGEGLDDAVERGQAFAAAGADVVFVEAIETEEQLAVITAALPSTPLVYNAVEGGRSPVIERAALARTGVRILIHPVTLLLEKVRAQRAAVAAMRRAPATPETIATARELLDADTAMEFHAAVRGATSPRWDPSTRRIAPAHGAGDEGELDVVLGVGGVHDRAGHAEVQRDVPRVVDEVAGVRRPSSPGCGGGDLVTTRAGDRDTGPAPGPRRQPRAVEPDSRVGAVAAVLGAELQRAARTATSCRRSAAAHARAIACGSSRSATAVARAAWLRARL